MFSRSIVNISLASFILFAFSSARAETLTFEVGAMLCLSGNCADWGNAALKGARLAAEEINKSGGVLGRTISLRVEDTQESISGATAVKAYQKLKSDPNIKYFIGPSWSPGALSIAPIAAKQAGILVITPSASAVEFNRASDHIFNGRLNEELLTRALARYSFAQGWKKAAIFSSQQAAENTQGRIFEDEFQKSGGSVTARLEPPPTLTNLQTEALKIISGSPDVVFLANYNQIDVGSRALSVLKFRGAKLAISLDEQRVKEAKGALENVVVAKGSEPSSSFKEKFVARYNEPPGLSADNGYDSMKMLALAITEAKSFDPEVVKVNLKNIRYTGTVGPITFNDERGIIQNPVLYRVVGETLVEIKEK